MDISISKDTVRNIGKIYTEKEFNFQAKNSIFFSSTPSPPVVYEFVIDEYLNINTKKIYDLKDEDIYNFNL